jgi:hypothetical protein
MKSLAFRIWLFAVAAACTASAAELRVTLVTPDASGPLPISGILTLRPLGDYDHATIRHSLNEGSAIHLPAGSWEVRYEASGWWHAPQYVVVTDKGAEVALRVRPAGQLAFHVVAADGRPRTSLALNLREGSGSGAVTIEVACPVDKKHNAVCSLPAGQFDLQLSVGNALSQFLGNLAVPAGKVRKIPLGVFRDGSALHGWVTVAKGVPPPREPVRVTLTQVSETRLQMPGIVRTGVADKKGFFRFQDISTGRYEIAATTTGLASERILERVRSSTEVALSQDLVLQAQKVVKVRITPPADPSGEPWRVKLARAGAGRTVTIGDGLTDGAGAWTSPEAPSGGYSVRVGRTDGSGWDEKLIQLADADLTVDFDLSPILIRGEVSLRGKPVTGAVTFGMPHGVVSTQFAVSQEGTFEGYVSKRTAYDLYFETEGPTIAHRFADVVPHEEGDGTWTIKLELPATVLEGIVVDDTGNPVKDAEVVAVPPQGARERPLGAWSSADGTFELVGLDPGRYRVSATSAGGRSTPLELTLRTDDVTSVRLIIAKDALITGRVLLPSLAPIAGARLQGYPTGLPMSVIDTVVTGADGNFQYQLPAGTKEADLLVLPPGAGLTLTHVAVGTSPLVITCSLASGTLVVDVPTRDGLPVGIFLMHNGAAALIGSFLNAWPTNSVNAGENRQQIEIGNVETGIWSVCLGKITPQASRPVIPSSCSPGGYLAPFGELRLTIPPP